MTESGTRTGEEKTENGAQAISVSFSKRELPLITGEPFGACICNS
jgi:hypothetical protein